MSTPVNDPELLAKLNGPSAPEADQSQAPASPGKPVTDPVLLSQLNGTHGATGKVEGPSDKLPFGDQIAIEQSDNFKEKELYFQHRYGDKNVTREWSPNGDPMLVVKTTEATYRIGGDGQTSFVAKIAANLPQIVGAGIGGFIGIPGGPGGMVAGAALGGMGAKALMEGDKAFRGEFAKSPTETAQALSDTAADSGVGEIGGQMAGKVISNAISASLPKFITGATDKSIAMTLKAHSQGALPPYASMAPDLMKLRRIETVAEKLTGKYAKQDEANMAFVKSELAEKLKNSGMPRAYVDGFIDEINGPEYAVSHNGVGEDLQASVRAHIESMTAGLKQSEALATSHVDAQLQNVRQTIDNMKTGDLSGDVGSMIASAKRDFDNASSSLYDKALSLVGNKKVVPTPEIAQEAQKIVDLIKEASPSTVQGVVRDMTKMAGRPLSADDAILMKEFGIELPPDGKMSLQAAQRLRTILRQKATGNGDLLHNTTQHDYGELADAVDRAIESAGADPAAKPAINALKVADEFYKKNIVKFNDASIDQLMKQIKSGAPPDPEKVVKMLTQTGGSTRIGTMRRMLGEDVWKRVQGVHLNQWMGKAETIGVDGKPTMDGMKLLNKLKTGSDEEKAFAAIHGPDAVGQMREVARMIAAREGKLDPAVLQNGDPKIALQYMQAQKARLDEFMSKNALAILADSSKTGEEAYQWIARPGPEGERRLMAAAKLFGSNSPQMAGLRQAALEEMARNASIHAINKSGSRAIENAMSQYTKNQQKMLFPDGLDKDMQHIGDVIKFMFPFKSGAESDANMASMHTGNVMDMPFKRRLYYQTVAAITRFIALHPTAARWIVTGRDEANFNAWEKNTAELFRRMVQTETMTMAAPDNSNADAPPPPAPFANSGMMPTPNRIQ